MVHTKTNLKPRGSFDRFTGSKVFGAKKPFESAAEDHNNGARHVVKTRPEAHSTRPPAMSTVYAHFRWHLFVCWVDYARNQGPSRFTRYSTPCFPRSCLAHRWVEARKSLPTFGRLVSITEQYRGQVKKTRLLFVCVGYCTWNLACQSFEE